MERISDILMRIAFAAVFAVNVQCAVSFIVWPGAHAGAYGLDGAGIAGYAALQGLGVAFLMWNATYPAYIAAPSRFKVLGPVILAQQLVGLIGESAILCMLASMPDAPATVAPSDLAAATTLSTLEASIERFIVFDLIGLIVMGASFIWWTCLRRSPIRRRGRRRSDG